MHLPSFCTYPQSFWTGVYILGACVLQCGTTICQGSFICHYTETKLSCLVLTPRRSSPADSSPNSYSVPSWNRCDVRGLYNLPSTVITNSIGALVRCFPYCLLLCERVAVPILGGLNSILFLAIRRSSSKNSFVVLLPSLTHLHRHTCSTWNLLWTSPSYITSSSSNPLSLSEAFQLSSLVHPSTLLLRERLSPLSSPLSWAPWPAVLPSRPWQLTPSSPNQSAPSTLALSASRSTGNLCATEPPQTRPTPAACSTTVATTTLIPPTPALTTPSSTSTPTSAWSTMTTAPTDLSGELHCDIAPSTPQLPSPCIYSHIPFPSCSFPVTVCAVVYREQYSGFGLPTGFDICNPIPSPSPSPPKK